MASLIDVVSIRKSRVNLFNNRTRNFEWNGGWLVYDV